MSKVLKRITQTDFIILALSVSGFLYILFRAILIPGYHDEINSFFIYIQTGNFLPFKAPTEQNNHILNSLFSFLLFKSFGTSLFIMRLANVLSSVVYFFYVWRIGKTFKSKNVALAWFITMAGSIYFISFFSLSRGYGLSMVFLTAAVYYLLAWFNDNKIKNILFGLVACSLSVWAFLGVMIPVLLIGGIFICLAIYRLFVFSTYRKSLVSVPGIILLYAVPIVYAVKYSFYIKTQKELFGSTTDSFLQSVLFNMADEFSGDPGNMVARIILFMIFTVIIVGGIFNFIKRKGINQPSTLIHLLLWGTIAGTIILNLFLGIAYPTSRMLIYYFVLIMIAFFLVVDEMEKFYINYVSYLVAGIFAFQLIYTLNLAYAPCWRYDTLPRSVYQKIADETHKTGYLPTISTTEILEIEYEFQNFEHKGKLNAAQSTAFPGKYSDYIISNDLAIIDRIADYDTILLDNKTRVSLLKRRKPVQWTEILYLKKPSIEGEEEFLSLADKQSCIPFRNHPFCVEVRFKAKSANYPLRCTLVCDVWDSTNTSLQSTSVWLQSIHSDIREEKSFHQKILFENIPAEASSLIFYCMNNNKTMIKLTDIEINLLKGEIE